MSVNLLTVPNNFDLYCNSLTINGQIGDVPTLIRHRVLNPTIGLAQGQSDTLAIASYTVRGVAGTLPAKLPFIDFNVLQNNDTSGDIASTIITVTIPEFKILSTTGSGTLIGFFFEIEDANLIPEFNIQAGNTIVQLSTTSGNPVYFTAYAGANTAGTITVIVLNTQFGPAPYGLYTDISFSYTLNG